MTEQTNNETDVLQAPGLDDWWRFTNSGRTVADKEKEAEAAFQQMRIARYLLSGGRGQFWLQDWSTYQPQA
jgi:hypothetical protein